MFTLKKELEIFPRVFPSLQNAAEITNPQGISRCFCQVVRGCYCILAMLLALIINESMGRVIVLSICKKSIEIPLPKTTRPSAKLLEEVMLNLARPCFLKEYWN